MKGQIFKSNDAPNSELGKEIKKKIKKISGGSNHI
jgi:hypothetical protein